MLTAVHARRECDGREGRGDDAATAGNAEDHCRKRLSAGAGGLGEVVAGDANDRAYDAAALEATGQDVGSEDGEGEGLVFSVGGVGPETGHFGEEMRSVDQNRGLLCRICFLSFVFGRGVRSGRGMHHL